MLSRLVRPFLLAALALPILTTIGAPASACENEVEYETNRRVKLLIQAEKDVDEGRFTLAAQAVANEFAALRTFSPGKRGLWDRAMRIMALALSRTSGAIRAGMEWNGATPGERAAGVEWAVTTMRALGKLRKDDPGMQTDLAEVLARDSRYGAEALKILGELAAKDLITSARGYRALAALRDQAGDAAGRDAALQRCRTMAKKADLCRIEDGRAKT